MNVNRSSLSRAAMALCMATFVGLLGLGVGCSDTANSIQADATAQGVQAGLNSALSSTVEPLVAFLPKVASIVNGPAPARFSLGVGLTCPDTSSVCGSGSVDCTVTGGGTTLTFVFDQCSVATGDLPLTLAGSVVATPGSTILLTLNGLVINGSPGMTGSGSVNVVACSYDVDVSTTDSAVVAGTIVKCDSDAYPTAASHLDLSFDDVTIAISFDGSSVAHAAANKSGDLVANCDINLAADPFSSSCSAP